MPLCTTCNFTYFVSLFTREWIEIALLEYLQIGYQSPSLRGSGLKFNMTQENGASEKSPSLRGSGLKFNFTSCKSIPIKVSLFTREWIEIDQNYMFYRLHLRSPSLRGSGLKQKKLNAIVSTFEVSLFTREWIEITTTWQNCQVLQKSPSLRGSGLKCPFYPGGDYENQSPSLRGSGLKFVARATIRKRVAVSLFTREWIEIAAELKAQLPEICLPLYEGVD